MITYKSVFLLLGTVLLSASSQDFLRRYAPDHVSSSTNDAFAYGVSVPHFGVHKHHRERRDDSHVRGEFTLMDPDGMKRSRYGSDQIPSNINENTQGNLKSEKAVKNISSNSSNINIFNITRGNDLLKSPQKRIVKKENMDESHLLYPHTLKDTEYMQNFNFNPITLDNINIHGNDKNFFSSLLQFQPYAPQQSIQNYQYFPLTRPFPQSQPIQQNINFQTQDIAENNGRVQQTLPILKNHPHKQPSENSNEFTITPNDEKRIEHALEFIHSQPHIKSRLENLHRLGSLPQSLPLRQEQQLIPNYDTQSDYVNIQDHQIEANKENRNRFVNYESESDLIEYGQKLPQNNGGMNIKNQAHNEQIYPVNFNQKYETEYDNPGQGNTGNTNTQYEDEPLANVNKRPGNSGDTSIKYHVKIHPEVQQPEINDNTQSNPGDVNQKYVNAQPEINGQKYQNEYGNTQPESNGNTNVEFSNIQDQIYPADVNQKYANIQSEMNVEQYGNKHLGNSGNTNVNYQIEGGNNPDQIYPKDVSQKYISTQPEINSEQYDNIRSGNSGNTNVKYQVEVGNNPDQIYPDYVNQKYASIQPEINDKQYGNIQSGNSDNTNAKYQVEVGNNPGQIYPADVNQNYRFQQYQTNQEQIYYQPNLKGNSGQTHKQIAPNNGNNQYYQSGQDNQHVHLENVNKYNQQSKLNMQREYPVILVDTDAKYGLPFYPSSQNIHTPPKEDEIFSYEGIPLSNEEPQEKNSQDNAQRRVLYTGLSFHASSRNLYDDKTPSLRDLPPREGDVIWNAGDETIDPDPEETTRQLNATCAYIQFNETSPSTEDGSKLNIWNAGDYSAQREEEELIRSVNITCENYTSDALSNFTNGVTLADYCSQCLNNNNSEDDSNYEIVSHETSDDYSNGNYYLEGPTKFELYSNVGDYSSGLENGEIAGFYKRKRFANVETKNN